MEEPKRPPLGQGNPAIAAARRRKLIPSAEMPVQAVPVAAFVSNI